MDHELISWNTFRSMTLRSGRYETLRVIASGGMATVHLARARGAGGFERLVALKVMHPHIARDPDFIDMFLDEARLAARIHHPNVVSTSDVQEDERGLFLVMDYVEGAALQLILRALWKRGRTVRIDVALRIFLDALAGLHAAHELKGDDGQPLLLVHRDVSPQNILVGIDGVTRLTDFGVARARSRLSITHEGQLKGKLTYMAPEQVRSDPIDRRADIYAAGVVLWEMLAGRRLVQGDSDASIMQNILAGVSRSPRDVNPEVPEEIASACMKALRNAPSERYSTAAELHDALETAADEAGVSIATPRGVASYLKEQDLPMGLPAEGAMASPQTPADPLGEQPTARDNVTILDRDAHQRAAQLDARPSSPARSDPEESRPPSRAHTVKRSMMVFAGVVGAVVIALAGWQLASVFSVSSRDGGAGPGLLGPRSGAREPAISTTGGLPLDPPSAVDVPSALPSSEPNEEPGYLTAPASGPSPTLRGGAGSKERGSAPSGSSSGPPVRAPAPSPTQFRPRDL